MVLTAAERSRRHRQDIFWEPTALIRWQAMAAGTSLHFPVSVSILTSKLPVATSIVHSKLDYCNSLYIDLPNFKIRLQQIQNPLTRTVVKFPRLSNITPVIKSLHWIKVKKRIEYKPVSLTYKVLTTSQPTYLSTLVTVQSPRSTRSLSVVTKSRPPTSSSLKLQTVFSTYRTPPLK